jgi:hypothetical protein
MQVAQSPIGSEFREVIGDQGGICHREIREIGEKNHKHIERSRRKTEFGSHRRAARVPAS